MDFDKLLDYLMSIDLTKAEGDSLILTEKADKTLYRIIEAEDFIKEAKEKLREKYLEVAKKNPHLKSYEGDHVRVGYRVTRRKFIDGDTDKKFYTVEKKPNIEAINAYADITGRLPEGISEKEFEYISFKRVGGNDES